MDLSELNSENVDSLTIHELTHCIQQLCGKAEWDRLSELNKTRYLLLFSAYIKFQGFGKYYTLEEFVKGDFQDLRLPIPDKPATVSRSTMAQLFSRAGIGREDAPWIRWNERGDSTDIGRFIPIRNQDEEPRGFRGRRHVHTETKAQSQYAPLSGVERAPYHTDETPAPTQPEMSHRRVRGRARVPWSQMRWNERGDGTDIGRFIPIRSRDEEPRGFRGHRHGHTESGAESHYVPLSGVERAPYHIDESPATHQSPKMSHRGFRGRRQSMPTPTAKVERLYPIYRSDAVDYTSHIDITRRHVAPRTITMPRDDDRLLTRTRRGYRYASPYPLKREQHRRSMREYDEGLSSTREDYGRHEVMRGERHSRRHDRSYTALRGDSAERGSSSETACNLTSSVGLTEITKHEAHSRPIRGRRHIAGHREEPYHQRKTSEEHRPKFDPSSQSRQSPCEGRNLTQAELNRRFAMEQSIRREQSIKREEQLREFRQIKAELKRRDVEPSTSKFPSKKKSEKQFKASEGGKTKQPVKEAGPLKFQKKSPPKPSKTYIKEAEPVPSTSGISKMKSKTSDMTVKIQHKTQPKPSESCIKEAEPVPSTSGISKMKSKTSDMTVKIQHKTQPKPSESCIKQAEPVPSTSGISKMKSKSSDMAVKIQLKTQPKPSESFIKEAEPVPSTSGMSKMKSKTSDSAAKIQPKIQPKPSECFIKEVEPVPSTSGMSKTKSKTSDVTVKIQSKAQPKPSESFIKEAEPVPSTSGISKMKSKTSDIAVKSKKAQLERSRLDLNTIRVDNINEFSTVEILEIVRPYYTEEQWSKTTRDDRMRYVSLFTTYIGNEDYRHRYTLEEFLRENDHIVEPNVHRTFGDIDIAKKLHQKILNPEECRQGLLKMNQQRALEKSRRSRICTLPPIPETEVYDPPAATIQQFNELFESQIGDLLRIMSNTINTAGRDDENQEESDGENQEENEEESGDENEEESGDENQEECDDEDESDDENQEEERRDDNDDSDDSSDGRNIPQTSTSVLNISKKVSLFPKTNQGK